MLDIRQLLTIPKTGIVDVVAWAMTTLGGFGLVIAALQVPMLFLMHAQSAFFGLWLIAAANFGLVGAIGVGLRRRRGFARVALILYLTLGVLWDLYWLAGALLLKRLPMIPQAMLEAPFRFAVIGSALFWSAVFVWLVFKFRTAEVAAQFARHDA